MRTFAPTLPPELRGEAPRHGPWAQIASGRQWWYLDPRPEDVCWRDIANALARICRFGGHLAEHVPHYSVAQHCCLVADSLPEGTPHLRLKGLLHDAHEAFIGDVTRPLKQALDALGDGAAGRALHLLELLTEIVIHDAAGIPLPTEGESALITQRDLRALATERRDLLADCVAQWDPLPAPWPRPLRPWSPLDAADEWLARLRRWLPDDAPVRV